MKNITILLLLIGNIVFAQTNEDDYKELLKKSPFNEMYPEFMAQEAADYFGVSWKAVNRWINRRKVGVKISHAIPCFVKGKQFAMTKDAAEYFGVSRQTIRNWVLQEEI